MPKGSSTRRRLEYGLARFVLFSLSVGSLRLSHFLAGWYVRLLDLLIPRLRRVANRNLVLAMPDLDEKARWRIADGSFRSLARLLVSLARMPQMTGENIGDWIRYEGLQNFQDAKARGKGVLFATAHLGNWELSAFAHGLMTEPMHVVVRALDNPDIDEIVTRLRTMSGNHPIEKRDFARGILRALGRNEAVGVLIDQNTAADEGVFVDFFGLKACAHPGFAQIAAHSGASIVPGYALWSEAERRYILRFDPPWEASGDAFADTQRIHTDLERVIREHPDQWLWIHRRWKTRPPGERPLY